MSTVTPSTDAEVFQHYFSHIKFLVSRYGFPADMVEDVASLMMLKFIEKGVLADYDPNKKGFEGRPANFKTFLSGFVSSYLFHYLQREYRRQFYEACSLDFCVGEDSETTYAEVALDTAVTDETGLEKVDLVLDISSYLVAHDRALGQAENRHQLSEFFLAVHEQVETLGRVNMTLLAKKFGVSHNTIQKWMRYLKEELREALS